MKDFSQDLDELQQKRRELDEQIHIAATMNERQKLMTLENELTQGRQAVKDLKAKAFQVAVANKQEITELIARVDELRSESINLSTDAVMLEHELGIKQRQVIELRREIEQAKIVV